MKRFCRFSGFVAIASTLLLAVVTGCSDDAKDSSAVDAGGTKPDAAADTGTTAQTGTVSGNIIYAGAQKGAIYVALFKSVSPSPSGLSGASAVFTPTLPGSSPYTVTNVPAGDYFISAYIAPAVQGQPPNPGPTTALSPFVPVTVTAGGTTTKDLTIVDPAPSDAGADGGDSGADADSG
jgi:hypothetical protein